MCVNVCPNSVVTPAVSIMSDQVTEGGSGGGGAAAAAAAAAVTSASSSAVAAAGGSVESPRRGSVPIVEHDPHADRVKFAHESVTAREEQLLDESQKAFNVFLDWLLQHSAKFPDLYFKVSERWLGRVGFCSFHVVVTPLP